ncbi:MAG: DUF58 domain-containing protein [Candidatus Latescibacterota bacterium]
MAMLRASSGTEYRKYLNPEVVSRLGRIDLVARLVVEGLITGLHRSPYHGFSAEFAEHRPYMPGDSVKNIDWKAYAKSDRFYVKEFEEETNLKAYLLLDQSGSMGFASGGMSKLEYGQYLAASLCHLLLRQRDAVGLITYDSQIRRYLPPRSVQSYRHVIFQELANAQSGAETDLAGVLHEVAERIHRRGLIVVLSDLMDDPDRLLAGLKHFRHRKHEVLVFHILDPRERDFAFGNRARFVGLETGEEIATESWHVARAYRERMNAVIQKIQRGCREHLIDYVGIDTSQDFDTALFAYLAKRKRMR